MSHQSLLAVGVLFLALSIRTTLSEDTWVEKVERRVKENLDDSIQWISGSDHRNDVARAKNSSFVKKMGIGIAVAFGCLAGALACLCAYICRRRKRTAQTQPLVRPSSLAPAPVASGSSIQVGPGYPYPQGPQPCNQPWSQAPYGQHQPRQPYPPSYSQPYPQQHPHMSEHLGATASPSAPTAPPASLEQMPMPPPPYEYKEMSRY